MGNPRGSRQVNIAMHFSVRICEQRIALEVGIRLLFELNGEHLVKGGHQCWFIC
jgi:hypothetical protein